MNSSASKEDRPLEVKSGSAVVKIYRTEKASGYVSYSVVYYKGMERKVRFIQDLAVAKTTAKSIADEIAQGDHFRLELTSNDKLAVQRAWDILSAFDIPIDKACWEYIEALKAVGSTGSILEACRDFAKRNSMTQPNTNVSDAVTAFKAQAEADGKSEVRRQDFASVLDRFVKSFNVEVGTLTPKLISDYLIALPFRERTKRNHRDVIKLFSRWLVLRGYLPKGTDLLEGVQNYSARKIGEITTFTPEEMTLLLQHTSERILPFLVIGGFAGLRHAEISRLDWQDIDLQEGFIEVKAENAKTDTRRIVPIKENLKAWLVPIAKKSGPVVGLANIANPLSKLARKAGVEWKHNALRHTYISARVAECADVPRVADEAGNSPQIIRTNYLKRMRPAFAAAWFNIMPGLSLAIPLSVTEKAAA